MVGSFSLWTPTNFCPFKWQSVKTQRKPRHLEFGRTQKGELETGKPAPSCTTGMPGEKGGPNPVDTPGHLLDGLLVKLL